MGFRVYRVSGLGFRCYSQPLFDPLVSGFKWDLMEGPEGCEQRGRVSNMDWTCCSPQCRVWGLGLGFAVGFQVLQALNLISLNPYRP